MCTGALALSIWQRVLRFLLTIHLDKTMSTQAKKATASAELPVYAILRRLTTPIIALVGYTAATAEWDTALWRVVSLPGARAKACWQDHANARREGLQPCSSIKSTFLLTCTGQHYGRNWH